ncbi:chromosome segregation protein SMC [Lactobacillaceae bacterium 24-114]
MQLLSLTLDGFKSFAQKTTIKFKPGMTGIVGPNGSGKSNVIEAIRWVMGEQSAHQLRGDKMADVIFNGSSDRKPLNRAFVSITFDNSDHYLASDYTELTITRKLYRNGDSEYLINGQSVRLKDIVDLFIDSGLGRESFSIISQGRIEAIFNGKPTDRRAIIETVAGVAKYKKNKDIAERRLDSTMDNLNRVNDIIAELSTQMEPLADESALAEDYLAQKSQYDLLDRTNTVHHYDELNHNLLAIRDSLQKADEMTTAYDDQFKQAMEQLTQLKRKQAEIQVKKDQLQAQILEKTETIGNLQNQQSISSVKREQQEHEFQRLQDRLNALQEQKNILDNEETELAGQIKEQTKQINARKEQLTAAKSMSSSQQIELANQQLNQLRDNQVDLMQQITTLQNQEAYLKSDHDESISMQAHNNSELSKAKQRLAEVKEQLDKASQEQSSIEQIVTKLRSDLQTKQEKHAATQTEYAQLQREWYEKLGDVHSFQSRLKNYHSMQEEYSGYYQGVQNVLKNRQNFAGLAGAVSELFDVPQQYTTAIETVLGSQLQQLVVDSQATGKTIINYLVRHRLGRVTILPLDTLQQRRSMTIFDQLTGLTGYIGKATDLINYNSQYEIVAQHLLGNTVVADNLDHATQISRQGHHYIRVVTLDGQVINASGAMTGGANRHQRIGLLSQKKLATQLESTLSNAQKEARKKETQIKQLQSSQEQLSQLINEDQEELRQATEKMHAFKGKYDLLQNEVKTLGRQISALQFQANEADDRHSDYESQIKDNHRQQAVAQEKFDAAKGEIASLQEQIKQLQSDETVQNEQLHAQEQWLAVAHERLQQLESRRNEQKKAVQELAINIDHCKDQQAQIQKQLNSDNDDAESNQEALIRLTKELAENKLTVNGYAEDLKQINADVETAESEHNRIRDLYDAANNERNNLDAKRIRLESKLDTCLSYLGSQYSMTIDEARQNLSDLPQDQLKTKLKLLKLGLDDLGEVNIGAIAEYKRVKERYDFLEGQQADLLVSRDQLKATMNEMDEQVKSRFIRTFNQVSTAFNQTFQQIFTGGQARLILTEPEDLLTTGIDIIAQPPGKKNQRMSLLSGGEKALTAITLLFAILKVRPVPFAILDEPEAALDEVNVQRFARYLNRFGNDGPQFIVITHRKGTMVNANVLYGVTMQESGVSRMVSVDVVNTIDEANE